MGGLDKQSEPASVGGNQVVKLSVALTADDIELILDYLCLGFTEARWKKDPKEAEAVYELYQTIGQAMGETDISLQFTVNDLASNNPEASAELSNSPKESL